MQDTHATYHSAIDLILPSPRRNLLVASHNEGSVLHTVECMRRCGVAQGSEGGVYFGQLLGMADRLTYVLASNGYKAYKYVPYGPVREVIPYLLRRAQENRCVCVCVCVCVLVVLDVVVVVSFSLSHSLTHTHTNAPQ